MKPALTARAPSAWAIAALACAPAAVAQSNLPEFGIFPGVTNSTDRTGLLNSSTGDVLVQVAQDSFRAVGQARDASGKTVGRLIGFHTQLQDEFAATPEFHWFTVIGPNPNGAGPDPTSGNELFRSTLMQTPSGPNEPQTWDVTVLLATPADILPASGDWYFGVGLGPAPTWPQDGLSVHMASYYREPGLLLRHDNPRSGAPDITWSIDRTRQIVSQAPTPRTHQIFLVTQGPVLNVGADIAPIEQAGPNPAFGVAGIYPDNGGRADGIAFRVRDLRYVGGQVVLLAAPGFSPSPLSTPIIDGDLWLNGLGLTYVTTATMPASGELVIAPPYLAQGQLPAGITGDVMFQAFNVTSSAIRASNAARVSFL